MAFKSIILLSILLYVLQGITAQTNSKRLVCYYDTESSMRFGYQKMSTEYLDKALSHCTHLVYASARLDPKTFDLQQPYRFVNPKNLRRRHPHLKIFLSLGGDKDDNDKHDPAKYETLLQSSRHKQQRFINSSIEIMQLFGFHGLDLAMPLPRNPPRIDSSLKMFMNDVNSLIRGDATGNVLKQHYTLFVSDLKEALERSKFKLAMTVLPNVNSTLYFDIQQIHNNFEFINLFAFDFLTPQRSPNEADHSAPLYFNSKQNRLPYANVDFQVKYWLSNGCPAHKLNLGIATYGRAWKMTLASGLSGVPIVEHTNGSGNFRHRTEMCDLISWTDICLHLPGRPGRPLSNKRDNYGNYGFRTAHGNRTGIWISYDDPDFATTKVSYANDKALGGVAIFDLAHDDFNGLCRGEEYPILRAVRRTLNITKFPEPRTYASVLRKAGKM